LHFKYQNKKMYINIVVSWMTTKPQHHMEFGVLSLLCMQASWVCKKSEYPMVSIFVIDDSSFVLSFLCYHWLSFCSHESSLHKVFTWFWLIVLFNGLCLLVFSFA
jgi:hypothetical protein